MICDARSCEAEKHICSRSNHTIDYQMETDELKSWVITQTFHVPIIRKELTNAIYTELNKIFPPIDQDFFYVRSWNCNETEKWIEFTLNIEYCFIKHSIGFQNPTSKIYGKLKTDFYRDIERIAKKLPSIISNGYPFTIRLYILESNESGCVIKLVSYPFLYISKSTYRTEIDDLKKLTALTFFQDTIQKLTIGLNAKDKSEYDLSSFSSFLGINQNWMSSTLALQLQEVSITIVSKKKGILLDKPSVERILNRQIQKDEPFFSCQYDAFVREANRRYGIEIPSMANWLRKMRQAVLHEGLIPKEEEREQVISATVSLLKELKKLCEAEEITTTDSTTAIEK